LVKWRGRHLYLFAGSAGSAVRGRFSLSCVGDSRALVLKEGRSIPIRDGRFTDSFANEDAIHIYRIEAGPACG
jgi:hypothetical protein